MTKIFNISPIAPIEPQAPAFKGNSEQPVEKAPEENRSHLLRNSLIALGVAGAAGIAAHKGVFGPKAEKFVKNLIGKGEKTAQDSGEAGNKGLKTTQEGASTSTTQSTQGATQVADDANKATGEINKAADDTNKATTETKVNAPKPKVEKTPQQKIDELKSTIEQKKTALKTARDEKDIKEIQKAIESDQQQLNRYVNNIKEDSKLKQRADSLKWNHSSESIETELNNKFPTTEELTLKHEKNARFYEGTSFRKQAEAYENKKNIKPEVKTEVQAEQPKAPAKTKEDVKKELETIINQRKEAIDKSKNKEEITELKKALERDQKQLESMNEKPKKRIIKKSK